MCEISLHTSSSAALERANGSAQCPKWVSCWRTVVVSSLCFLVLFCNFGGKSQLHMILCHCGVNSTEKSANSTTEWLLLVTCTVKPPLSGSGTSFYPTLIFGHNFLFLVNCACGLWPFLAVQVGSGTAHTFSIDGRVVRYCRWRWQVNSSCNNYTLIYASSKQDNWWTRFSQYMT